MPTLDERTLALLDLWYFTCVPGWVGAVEDHPPPREWSGAGARPRALGLSDDTHDSWRPLAVDTLHWFAYPGDAQGLASWIEARPATRVWITGETHPTTRIRGHREGDLRGVIVCGWKRRRWGRNIRLAIARHSVAHRAAHG